MARPPRYPEQFRTEAVQMALATEVSQHGVQLLKGRDSSSETSSEGCGSSGSTQGKLVPARLPQQEH